MRELITLWENTLGEAPPKEQFAIWSVLHAQDFIRRAILKTAIKNQTLGGKMDADHKARFASRVMMTLTEHAAEHAANKERLRQEFDDQKLEPVDAKSEFSEEADNGVILA